MVELFLVYIKAMQLKIPESLNREIAKHEFICGSDEVGLGSWAGPLYVCAVIVHKDWFLDGVTDSKKLSPVVRERLYPTLKTLTHCVTQADSKEIDLEGVGNVWFKLHIKAIQGALEAHKAQGHTNTPLVIIDGNRGLPGAFALPKADQLIHAVSAASIIAKVTRDRVMQALDVVYKGYGFRHNAGYGTSEHKEALLKLGVSPVHRMSYSPMSDMKELTKTIDLLDLLETLG